MHYKEWLEEYYPHLYEIFYHIIVPARDKLREKKNESTVTFSEFCRLSFETHGSRVVRRINGRYV